tara:strand:- start:885 stop:3173 length:2289 start_codon:yes stop_codon:yes gene_type:complete
MAGPAVTELQVKLTTTGVEKLPQLSRAFSTFGRDVKKTELEFKQFAQELRKHGSENAKSINNTRALANTWEELAASVEFGSKEFKEATAEAKRLNIELNKMEKGGGKGIRGRLRGAAKTVGTVAAAGIFGGPEGLIGAGLGSLGGPGGAVLGGAIGASLGGLRQSIGEMGKYNASLKQQRFALKLVINDTEKYNQAQKFLAKTSEELAIPQDVIVRQFTALTASVTGAGHSVEDAQDVFLSIASGIRGTGGSLEDMRSAMVATAQVFSKGKVSAEELRQQLGERLPGAFTLFAASMNMMPKDLDKALEQGKVTLEDFLGFSKHLFNQYGENAKILADSPAAAGDRLAKEFADIKDNFGGLFANIGAGLQDTTTNILKFLNDNQEAIKKSITNIVNRTTGTVRVLKKIGEDISGILSKIMKIFVAPFKFIFEKIVGFVKGVIKAIRVTLEAFETIARKLGLGRLLDVPWITIDPETKDLLKNTLDKLIDPIKDYTQDIKDLFTEGDITVAEAFGNPKYDALIENIQKTTLATKQLGNETGELDATTENVYKNMQLGAKSYFESIKDLGKQIQDATENAFKKMEDALTDFVMTGKLSFRNFVNSILKDIARIAIRQSITGPLSTALSGVFSNLGTNKVTDPSSIISPAYELNALGNIYAQNGIVPFAKGGIVNSPYIFPFKNGTGLMGEAGPEAIMPLRRGAGGRLGVEASGAGVGNIIVNVDASGTEIEGSEQQGKILGQLIGAAVQSELIQQSRPGGLLNPA